MEMIEQDSVDVWELLISKALRSEKSIFEQVEDLYGRAVNRTVRGQVYKYCNTENRLEKMVVGIIKDYIWTLNVPYIDTVINAAIQCVLLGEEKFQQAFGGWNPKSNQFGIVKIHPEDMPFGERGEAYDLPPSRLVMLTGFITKGEEGVHSATIDAGSTKLPRVTFYRPDRGNICLLNTPTIIMYNSYLKAVLRNKDGNVVGGNDRLIGYWFVANPDILLRREI
ncbi:MAG: hypothetical protein M0R06_10190 [Sphaerochaeta sp.]|jgi:hypothetical protein|nr:hypothetical protein [Sphaerochaeta sp.]MDD2730575.1 hypothetical protein [Candidatus Portnoybacteria bacterium]